jgi:hypothetical protein
MGSIERSLGLALLVACGTHHHKFLDAGVDSDIAPCSGLACNQYDCATKGLPPTSVSGTVYAPNGTLPLYGVNVYVPVSDPGPLPAGVTCQRCADGLPGGALAQAVTDEKGHFTLLNVPAANDVPLVIQVGKWRRQLKLGSVAACQDFPLGTADTTLPKSRDDLTPATTSVDMPQIAISTGDADALECLVLKLGIDPKEISSSTKSGRIHLYTNTMAAGQGAATFVPGWAGGTDPMTDSQAFWNTTTSLAAYDIVILSCEGGQYPATKTQTAMQAMHDYADMGGRVFASHWHNIWIGGEAMNAPHGLADWEAVADFNFGGNPSPDTLTATIDEVNNPKGMSFATWMLNVGGSTMRDLLTVTQARTTCTKTNAGAERWVYLDTTTSPGFSSAMNFQFTTPLQVAPDQRCGKVVFSDMHVSADSTSLPGTPYPNGCSTMPLTAQEKALAFMFFDIASCVGPIQ